VTVRVVIVDDSPTMRGLISATLSRDPEIEIVGSAADPYEARAAIKALNPDVVTLDVEMPNMNGLEFLEKIMRLRPMPVVMVSTLTQKGAEVTLAALELGAVDAVGKPGAGVTALEAFADLAERVKVAARSRVRASSGVVTPRPETGYRAADDHVLANGASTGGRRGGVAGACGGRHGVATGRGGGGGAGGEAGQHGGAAGGGGCGGADGYAGQDGGATGGRRGVGADGHAGHLHL